MRGRTPLSEAGLWLLGWIVLQVIAFGLWRGQRPLWAVVLLVAGLGVAAWFLVGWSLRRWRARHTSS